MSKVKYASVIVDIAVDDVDRLFTYIVPEAMSVFEGQRVVVPFGRNRTSEALIVKLFDTPPDISNKLKEIIAVCEDYPVLDIEQLELAGYMQKVYHCTFAMAVRQMIPAGIRRSRVKEKKIRTVILSENADISLILSKKTRQAQIVELLQSASVPIAVSDIYELLGNQSSALSSLIKKGIIEEKFLSVYRKPSVITNNYGESAPPELFSEQKQVLDRIKNALDNNRGMFLLHGVTGSGKTEVYMHAIEYALKKGKGAIVLVPEISLTPQTVGRFLKRFGDNVAVIHSRLSEGERFDEWRRIRKGEVFVVVGARSAVFAPVKNLGIIVIDEEHESSYTSESIPQYSAIQIAKRRCKALGAVLVLGSATPSVSTFFQAQNGVYEILSLPSRINQQLLPSVVITDMRIDFMNGNTGCISKYLETRLDECLSKKEQAILFVNRRGYSGYIMCRACGYVFMCDECDVSMTYHKLENRMKCHYCGKSQSIPTMCPKCNKPYLKPMGIGTQQVETEFIRLFSESYPNAACIRMDRDTTHGKDAHEKLLEQFRSQKASVLIGTQMIAKGLDFPNVTLVGVISTDSMLCIPDYRNCEHTFQLLTQVAGRAGRAEKSGTVVIQTSTPEHPIIKMASRHDYKSFYEYAIREREKGDFPPFSVFVRVLFASKDDEKAKEEVKLFADKINEKIFNLLSGNVWELLFIYAMPAPIQRIQGKYRYHVIMKLKRTKNTASIIDSVYELEALGEFSTLSCVEVNPNDML